MRVITHFSGFWALSGVLDPSGVPETGRGGWFYINPSRRGPVPGRGATVRERGPPPAGRATGVDGSEAEVLAEAQRLN